MRRGPQRDLRRAAVAREALVIAAVHGHGAELARIVAPDAGDEEARGSGRARGRRTEGLFQRRPALAGLQPVELGGGFAHVHGDQAGWHGQRCRQPGQLLGLGALQRPHQQGQVGATAVQPQAGVALGLGALHAGQGAHGGREAFAEQAGVAGGRAASGAHIGGRGQGPVQPLLHGAAKTADHDGEGHGQAQAGHHPAHGHAGAGTHAPRALEGQQPQRAA
ncbi:hypothetical protein D3C78_1221610 [compost metagenome]